MSGFTFPITLPLTWTAPRPAGFWLGQDRDLAVKVLVSRPDGHTWTDVSSYVRYINRKRGDVSSVGTGQTGADAMSQTCTLRLMCARRRTPAGEIVGDSFHPLVRTSPWNLFDVDGDGADEYAPLLWPNREIVIDVSAVPAGATPGMCDWFRMFHGYLGDGIDGDASSPEVTIECRDGMKLLMDTFIEVEREYGSEAGTPAEIVMQQIIDDNMTAGPRVYCPISPGLMIKPYKCTYKTVADALVEIANQCAWWIGWRWIPDYNDFRLAFLAPPRGKDASAADWLLDWNENMLMQTLRISDREVRNALTLTFRNEATGLRETVIVEDAASIAAFGRRAMGIEEKDTSLISTPAEALAMATAAVHDQKDLPALTEIELPFLPTLDIFDGIVVHNPLLSSTDDFYAVHTAEDVLEVQGDKLRARTRVAAAGRVMGGLHKWRKMETRPGAAGNPVRTGQIAPAQVITDRIAPEAVTIADLRDVIDMMGESTASASWTEIPGLSLEITLPEESRCLLVLSLDASILEEGETPTDMLGAEFGIAIDTPASWGPHGLCWQKSWVNLQAGHNQLYSVGIPICIISPWVLSAGTHTIKACYRKRLSGEVWVWTRRLSVIVLRR